MKDVLVLLATMGGGLGCFLLGMKHLSEGLQSVGGAGLKRFMSAMTTNRIAGMMTGVVSTIIVQSSSIITVMTVGFVSSGLMDLTPESHVVTLNGKRLALTLGEYRMLELFLSRPNRIHTRVGILDAIQTEAKDVTDRLVDVMLVALRRKLGAWATHIETVRGIGYRLC